MHSQESAPSDTARHRTPRSETMSAQSAAKVIAVARQLVHGRATVEDLRNALEAESLPYAHVTSTSRLRCPHCRAPIPDERDGLERVGFRWVEDISSSRDVQGTIGHQLLVDTSYRTDGWDDFPLNERILCRCGGQFVLPRGYEPTWWIEETQRSA